MPRMTDIQQRIEDIVAKHGELEDCGGACECGWWIKDEAHAAHVAQVIATGLGLIQEWGIWFADTYDEPMPGNRHAAGWEVLDKKPSTEICKLAERYSGRAIGNRWVTKWENDND